MLTPSIQDQTIVRMIHHLRIALPRVFCLGVFVILGVSVSHAEIKQNLPPELEALGWEEITFDGKRPNAYASCGDRCIEVKTDSSVSMIGKPVSIDLEKMPFISWEWKISNALRPTDLSTKGKDDRAAAVYVTFPYDPDTSSFKERMMRPLIEAIRGKDTPGRILSYVWGGFGETSDIIESPFYGGINAMIISRNEQAPINEWVMEKFDVISDHKRAFGYPPKSVSNILISADSDDTEAPNQAFIRNITFVKKD